MYHSVTFGDKNSYTDWHLVPDSRPVVAMPEPKTMMVEVPGANGVLDLSESLTNYPTYKNREGSFKFHVLSGYKDWNALYTEIATYLHGRVRAVVLEDDPDFFYRGRHKIEWVSNNDGSGSEVEITYEYEPYKYYKYLSTAEDPEKYRYISNTGTNRIDLSHDPTIGTVPVVPKLIAYDVSGTFKVSLWNAELNLNLIKRFSENTTVVCSDFMMSNLRGNNTIYVDLEGTGKLSIEFRRASL